MSDAAATPFTGLAVRIFEDPLLPLREVEDDLRSAAQLIGFAIWLGSAGEGELDSQLLDPETIDLQQVRRIRYGSPLEVVIEAMPYALGYAYAVLPLVEKLLVAVGRVRKGSAQANEANAHADLYREQAETLRSERRSREYREKFESFREAAESLLDSADENDEPYVRNLILQAEVDPESLDDSIEALQQLSKKRVNILVMTESGPDDPDLDVRGVA